MDNIDNTLEKIKAIWKHYPTMRLGQLIATVLNYSSIYYISDAELIKGLSQYYKINTDNIVYKSAEDKQTTVEPTLSGNMRNVGAANKGRVYIHKGSDIKSVYKAELEYYLNEGYTLGRKDNN